MTQYRQLVFLYEAKDSDKATTPYF